MSCCPGHRCKNTGSGYEKIPTGNSAELDARMKELMAARDAQDARILARPVVSVVGSPQVPKQPAQPSNTVAYFK